MVEDQHRGLEGEEEMKTIEWDLMDHPIAHVAHDWIEDGVRCLVMRGPSSWNAYIGIPKDHPLAGFGYEDIPISVHGGLTFARSGEGEPIGWPEDRYWYGWDYGHAGDCCSYNHDPRITSDAGRELCRLAEKHWTADDVKREISEALWEFNKLVKLAEKIAAKPK